MQTKRDDLRNIAIIAHVDHGKTTLVDEMLKQSGVFRENQHVQDRIMDSGDLERERGITILAKNTAVTLGGIKINIVDTPGHSDFGGEVERVLKMVNGVLLLVDSFEGPMPQTRFVLQKALELSHPVVLVINKVDRPDSRPREVTEETLSLLIDLGADEKYLDSPVVYASGRNGTASLNWNEPGMNLAPLFEAILSHIPAPVGDDDAPLQLLVSTIDYSDYVGRIGIGRIERGAVTKNQMAVRTSMGNPTAQPTRVAGLFTFDGLKRVETDTARVGDIVALCGIEDINIGDTVCAPECPEPLPFVSISEPTVEVTFLVNNSPFAGREGSYVTSRHLRERLRRETLTDVSLRVEDTDAPDAFKVCGRGELHISILIENMRRQGYEFQISKPRVLMREVDGVMMEPMERVVIDVPQESSGAVIQELGRRRGVLTMMNGTDRIRLEFSIPSRGLFGYRGAFMTDTRGEGIMSSVFDGYEPYKGEIASRMVGSLVAFEDGEATAYALSPAQERGTLMITPGVMVYTGMIVGRSNRAEDIGINVCRKKHLTAIHNNNAAEDSLRLQTVRPLSLEEAIEFIEEDELVEVTPLNIRLRKRILNAQDRLRSQKKKAGA